MASLFDRRQGGGWTVLYLIFPSLLSILASVEPRYFVQIDLVLFVYLAAFCPYRKVWRRVRSRPVSHAILLIALLGGFAAITNLTTGLNADLTNFLIG